MATADEQKSLEKVGNILLPTCTYIVMYAVEKEVYVDRLLQYNYNCMYHLGLVDNFLSAE